MKLFYSGAKDDTIEDWNQPHYFFPDLQAPSLNTDEGPVVGLGMKWYEIENKHQCIEKQLSLLVNT